MKTTDLCDEFDTLVKVAEPVGFKMYGRRKSFYGKMETVKCYEDNSLVRAAVESAGPGKVLVVDGGGSLRCALLGDNIAGLALKNEWAGILIHGCVRDSAALAEMEIGIVALGTNPRKSAKRNEGSSQIDLHFAGADFFPGGYIYIDEDGIVTSQKELLPSPIS